MDEEVRDLISQMHMKPTVQFESRMGDLGSATYCLLFFLRDSANVTDVQGASRAHNDLAVHHLDKERGSPLFHSNAEGHREDPGAKDWNGELILPDQKGGSSGDAQVDSRKPDATQIKCMGKSVHGKVWSITQVAERLRCRRMHCPQMEKAGSRW